MNLTVYLIFIAFVTSTAGLQCYRCSTYNADSPQAEKDCREGHPSISEVCEEHHLACYKGVQFNNGTDPVVTRRCSFQIGGPKAECGPPKGAPGPEFEGFNNTNCYCLTYNCNAASKLKLTPILVILTTARFCWFKFKF